MHQNEHEQRAKQSLLCIKLNMNSEPNRIARIGCGHKSALGMPKSGMQKWLVESDIGMVAFMLLFWMQSTPLLPLLTVLLLLLMLLREELYLTTTIFLLFAAILMVVLRAIILGKYWQRCIDREIDRAQGSPSVFLGLVLFVKYEETTCKEFCYMQLWVMFDGDGFWIGAPYWIPLYPTKRMQATYLPTICLERLVLIEVCDFFSPWQKGVCPFFSWQKQLRANSLWSWRKKSAQ